MKRSIQLLIAVTSAVLTLAVGCHAQSTNNSVIENIITSQDQVAAQMAERLRSGGGSAVSVATDVQAFANALVTLQTAETNAYHLVAVRDMAAQTMTRVAWDKASREAKAMGVSDSQIACMRMEWMTAPTPGAAFASVTKMQQASAIAMMEASKTGGFFRAMPTWLGGTTEFANYRTPRADDINARIARLESLATQTSVMTGVMVKP